MFKLVRKSPENVEKIARFLAGEKGAESCHGCGCHGLFGPEWYSLRVQLINVHLSHSGGISRRHL